MNFLILIILLLNIFCFKFISLNKIVDEIDFSSPDISAITNLIVTVHNKINAYKSINNDRFLKEKKYDKLKWYSYGHPEIIENPYSISTENENHHKRLEITSTGLKTYILGLTSEDVKLFKKEIQKKYKIKFKNDDHEIINQFPYSSFKCKIEIYDENMNLKKIYGEVKDFENPMSLEFKAKKDELELIKKQLFNISVIDCEIQANNGFKKNILLNPQNCNDGGVFACQNDGVCFFNGTCKCADGYYGFNCSIYRADGIIEFIKKHSKCKIDFEKLLILATEKKNFNVVKELLESNVNVNSKENGTSYTALMKASYNGHTDMVKLFIKHLVDINAKDKNGNTALIEACKEGYLDIAKLLIENNADVNAKDNQGDSPLMLSSFNGNIEIVKLLISKNANINDKNNVSMTALSWAIESKNIDVIKLLIENKADVNNKDIDDLTPLMTASMKGMTDVVKILIENKADTKAKNNEGMSALDFAVSNDRTEIIELLKNV